MSTGDQSITRSHYDVIVDPTRLELRVEWRFTGAAARGHVRAEIPAWAPGDYSFSPLARDVFDVQARTADGRTLEVQRDGRQAWVIHDGGGDIRVTWRAWAYEIDFAEPSGIVDGAYAILLGARYLHTPAWPGACSVHYHVPDAWRDTLHHPSGAKQIGPQTWEYPTFEILLDTPVAMGDIHVISRDVCGTPFHCIFVDKGVGFDEVVERFVGDVLATARTFHDMFGEFPFEDYTFVLTLNPAANWALEHLSSSMCGLGPDVFTDPDRYALGVRVCAHELFHAWNVRRLRPSPLGELASHLQSGSFSAGLWIAEGFTRYYEFLSCTRAGVYTPQQFISTVVGYFSHLTVLPAYGRVSAADSSLAAYLNHSPKYPGRCNNSIDYYDKGMLIAFGLDARLRQAGTSLDAAFAEFYRRYQGFGPGIPGYTMDQVVDFFGERAPDLSAVLQREALECGPLDTINVLRSLGFQPRFEDGYMLGLMFLNGGEPKLYNVLDDSPAGATGIAPEDVITGVNGYAYTRAGLFWAANRAAPVEIRVLRGQRVLDFTISPKPVQRIADLVWSGTEEQAAMLFQWFGRRFELANEQVFPLDFYENLHGVETVV
jgi:predicted metalloprotease with PDZ domain